MRCKQVGAIVGVSICQVSAQYAPARHSQAQWMQFDNLRMSDDLDMRHLSVVGWLQKLNMEHTPGLVDEAVFAKPLRCLFRVVGEDNVSASTTEARQCLKRDLALIEPPALHSGLEHGVLT